MTLFPRPLSKLTALAPLAFAVLVGALVTSGCEDKHIGRVCALDVQDAGSTATGSTATINGQAVECPTRICLKPGGDKTPATTGALCTATCGSDDDCSDGETSSDPKSAQCKTGFVCMVATTVGSFCCEKMCVCKDFVDTQASTFERVPASCMPGQSMCVNVH